MIELSENDWGPGAKSSRCTNCWLLNSVQLSGRYGTKKNLLPWCSKQLEGKLIITSTSPRASVDIAGFAWRRRHWLAASVNHRYYVTNLNFLCLDQRPMFPLLATLTHSNPASSPRTVGEIRAHTANCKKRLVWREILNSQRRVNLPKFGRFFY